MSHLYQTNKDENEIITLGCSGGEQAEHHHDKYSSVQNLWDSFINPAQYVWSLPGQNSDVAIDKIVTII